MIVIVSLVMTEITVLRILSAMTNDNDDNMINITIIHWQGRSHTPHQITIMLQCDTSQDDGNCLSVTAKTRISGIEVKIIVSSMLF